MRKRQRRKGRNNKIKFDNKKIIWLRCCVCFLSCKVSKAEERRRHQALTLSSSVAQSPPPPPLTAIAAWLRREWFNSTTYSSQVFSLISWTRQLFILRIALLLYPILIEGMNEIATRAGDCFLFRFNWIFVLSKGCVISVIFSVAMCGTIQKCITPHVHSVVVVCYYSIIWIGESYCNAVCANENVC